MNEKNEAVIAEARKLAFSMSHSAGQWMVPGYDGRKVAEILNSLSVALSASSPSPTGEPTDEQLRAAFTLDSGGPNPYYRCNECGKTEPGLQEYLAAHWMTHHASPPPSPVAQQAEASEATELGDLRDAVRDVLAERQRQISAEGWTPEHDDKHDKGEIAVAAALYALRRKADPVLWVTSGSRPGWAARFLEDVQAWVKPCDSRRSLVKAGALILAELERHDRASPTPPQASPTDGGE